MTDQPTDAGLHPATAALLRQIDAHRAGDPLIGAKVGAREVFGRVIQALQGERGVHIESLLCALGALAGYACQAGVQAQLDDPELPDPEPFTVVEATDGTRYRFGNALNAALVESEYSVWSLAAGAAQDAGASTFPELEDLFRHVSTSIGTPAFGVPRLPEDHRPAALPIDYLNALWQPLLPTLQLFCPDPRQWHLVYALAVQEAIALGKQALDPALALRIVMECALPMSKVLLQPAAPPQTGG